MKVSVIEAYQLGRDDVRYGIENNPYWGNTPEYDAYNKGCKSMKKQLS